MASLDLFSQLPARMETTETLQEKFIKERNVTPGLQDDLEDDLEEEDYLGEYQRDYGKNDFANIQKSGLQDADFANLLSTSERDDSKKSDTFERPQSPGQPESWISDPLTTKVGVSHSLIREYFQERGLPEASSIGVRYNDSHYNIAKVCMEILTDNEPKLDGADSPEPNLRDYAAKNFIPHLRRIDRASLDRDEITAIVFLLAAIFSKPPPLRRCLQYHKSSPDSPLDLIDTSPSGNAASVQEWLLEDICQERFSQLQLQWIERTKTSFKGLLYTFASVVACEWLKEKQFLLSAEYCIRFLDRYRRMVSFLVPKEAFFPTSFLVLIAVED